MSIGHSMTTTRRSIQKEMKDIPAFRRISPAITHQFTMNLSLVAHGIRSGYLLDLFTPQDPVQLFSRLLSALRSKAETKGLFGHVVHVYEPAAEQSFFVTAMVFAERIEGIIADSDADAETSRMIQRYPVFIYLGPSIKPLDGVPASVARLLEAFRELHSRMTSSPMSYNNSNTDIYTSGAVSLHLSLSLPENTDMPDAVALAAVLLDYAVAYIPSHQHANVLAGIPLDFYECILKLLDPGTSGQSEGEQISFAKFSCPSDMREIAVDKNLLPENIVAWLTELFDSRLRRSGYQDAQVEVRHTVQILNHVTF